MLCSCLFGWVCSCCDRLLRSCLDGCVVVVIVVVGELVSCFVAYLRESLMVQCSVCVVLLFDCFYTRCLMRCRFYDTFKI